MSTATTALPSQREPELLGQTVIVIGGSAGIGLETARRANSVRSAPRPSTQQILLLWSDSSATCRPRSTT